MSPGNRAIDTMIAAYNAEYNKEEYKDPSLNIALVETHYPEIINNGGYRQAAIIELPIKYQHVKMIGKNKLIKTCNTPGSFSRWWNNIKIGDVWECSICKGKWEWRGAFPGDYHSTWFKSE